MGPVGALLITGTAGLVEGVSFRVDPGASAVLVLSRACGLSLHVLGETAEALAATPEGKAFRSISRRHVTIRLEEGGRVQVVDRSRHGTYLDGERIDTVILTDLAERPHELRLGSAETFRMELA